MAVSPAPRMGSPSKRRGQISRPLTSALAFAGEKVEEDSVRRSRLDSDIKHQHWCGDTSIYVRNAAPVIAFTCDFAMPSSDENA